MNNEMDMDNENVIIVCKTTKCDNPFDNTMAIGPSTIKLSDILLKQLDMISRIEQLEKKLNIYDDDIIEKIKSEYTKYIKANDKYNETLEDMLKEYGGRWSKSETKVDE